MQAQATMLWGFLNTLTKFIYTPRIMIGTAVEKNAVSIVGGGIWEIAFLRAVWAETWANPLIWV